MLRNPLQRALGLFLSRNANAFGSKPAQQPRMAVFGVIQVRTSTKRSSGSTTNNKDSAGRRLGVKKQEGVLVKTGQILYRQRGTKIYPGENAGIGRDHTIFALEPGYVRYYLDPFHPKRKFVGVALTKDARLPTDHWAPRMRRFGYVQIKNPKEAEKEELHLPRKDWLLKQKLDKELEARLAARAARKEQFKLQLVEFGVSVQDPETAASRLDLVRRFLRGGVDIAKARKNATFNDLYDLKLALKRGDITQEEHTQKSQAYSELAEKLDSEVEFNCEFDLVKAISPEAKEAMKSELQAQLAGLTTPDKLPYTKEIKKTLETLISDAAKKGVLTLSETVRLRRRYLKPVLGEHVGVVDKPTKKTVTYKKYDYELGKVVEVHREKNAFLSKVN